MTEEAEVIRLTIEKGGGRGRPLMPESERRSVWLRLRCTRATYARYVAAAKAEGVKLSPWVRSILAAACDETAEPSCPDE